MAKPRLEKVEALFYVLKQVAKGGCIRILIHPLLSYIWWDMFVEGLKGIGGSWLSPPFLKNAEYTTLYERKRKKTKILSRFGFYIVNS